MSGWIALTRPVSASLADCQLTHLERTPIDIPLAREQHRAYENALRDAGCDVIALPAADDLPDAVFVEDAAVALDEVAVITRPGAESRRRELDGVAAELGRHRPLLRIEPPGTLDGGDVLRIGRTLYVGRSERTNDAAIEQLRRLLEPYGYTVVAVDVTGCLHLKTAVTLIAPDTLLINRKWIDVAPLSGCRLVDVAPGEPFAANALLVGDVLLTAQSFPRTNERLAALGLAPQPVDASELAKAEGGLTCCSILLPSD